jgi:2-polyprenyl-3-methyl-5-hydroxy-6-metoxy-1,4-benzoquinol methylase
MKEYDHNHWSRETNPERAIEKYIAVKKGRYQTIRNGFILSKLIATDLNGKKVMDYGCRVGYFSIQLAKRGAEVIGLDISPEAIDTARYYAAREGVGSRCFFLVCNPDAREFGNFDTFDFPVLKDIIEHIENDRNFLSVAVTHLKPAGNMLLTTPNFFPLGHFFDVLYPRWYLGDKTYVGGADQTHVRLYNTFQLKKLMMGFGLHRRKLYAVGIFPINCITYLTLFRYTKSF